MGNLFLRKVSQILFPLALFLRLSWCFPGRSDDLFHGWLRNGFITIRFRFIEKGKLSGNIFQFFRVPAKTLLVCKPHLFHEIFVVPFRLVKPVLHLVNDTVLGLMIHLVQFIGSEFFTHTACLSF